MYIDASRSIAGAPSKLSDVTLSNLYSHRIATCQSALVDALFFSFLFFYFFLFFLRIETEKNLECRRQRSSFLSSPHTWLQRSIETNLNR